MRCQAVVATAETNSFLVCSLEQEEDGAKEKGPREDSWLAEAAAGTAEQ